MEADRTYDIDPLGFDQIKSGMRAYYHCMDEGHRVNEVIEFREFVPLNHERPPGWSGRTFTKRVSEIRRSDDPSPEWKDRVSLRLV